MRSQVPQRDDGTKHRNATYNVGEPHGRWTDWNAKGNVGADGEWRDGKPWEGTCGVPALGDAGSVGGIEVFGLYHQGKLVKEAGGLP